MYEYLLILFSILIFCYKVHANMKLYVKLTVIKEDVNKLNKILNFFLRINNQNSKAKLDIKFFFRKLNIIYI